MSGSILMNETDFSNSTRTIPKIIEEKIPNIMKRGTRADFGHTNEVRHTDTKQKVIPEETETSNENPEQQHKMALRRAFAPRQATPAVQLFTPLPSLPSGGFKLDNGRKTQDFVPLVARSNAGYLGWVNRFNSIPQGTLPR